MITGAVMLGLGGWLYFRGVFAFQVGTMMLGIGVALAGFVLVIDGVAHLP